MPTLPPIWRKRIRRHWLPLGLGALAVVMTGMLSLNVLKDFVGVLLPHPDAPPAPQPSAAASVVQVRAAPDRTSHPAPDGPFVVRSILSIPDPIKFGQFYWDESKGAPGPVVITVDLTARVLSVFEDGHEIGTSAILKGYGDKPTPLGVFPITQKDATHVSNLYDAPMPWMLRLTNDGVSIHGSKVEKGYATNGCIGVPDAFAEKLFRVTHLGDRVIITDGKTMQLGDQIIAAPKT
jgi:lipoprotein-anchoring transpeptidase ErfK/SrfK